MTFKFMNMKPGPVTQLLTLTYPFDSQTWSMSILSCIFAFFAIFLANFSLNSVVTAFQAVSFSLSPVLREPMPANMDNIGHHWYTRVVLNIWFLSGILLSYAYSCNLLANLVSVSTEKPVDTFQDILDNGHMLTVLEGNSLLPYMASSDNPVIKRVYEVKIKYWK